MFVTSYIKTQRPLFFLSLLSQKIPLRRFLNAPLVRQAKASERARARERESEKLHSLSFSLSFFSFQIGNVILSHPLSMLFLHWQRVREENRREREKKKGKREQFRLSFPFLSVSLCLFSSRSFRLFFFRERERKDDGVALRREYLACKMVAHARHFGFCRCFRCDGATRARVSDIRCSPTKGCS